MGYQQFCELLCFCNIFWDKNTRNCDNWTVERGHSTRDNRMHIYTYGDSPYKEPAAWNINNHVSHCVHVLYPEKEIKLKGRQNTFWPMIYVSHVSTIYVEVQICMAFSISLLGSQNAPYTRHMNSLLSSAPQDRNMQCVNPSKGALPSS